MSNKYQHHLIVLPEDDANYSMVNGFLRKNLNVNERAIEVLPIAGGWKKTIDQFNTIEVPGMRKYSLRMMLLLIDFDGVTERLASVQNEIPDDLKNRVFVLGAKYNPELLREDLGKSFGKIGEELAKDCPENQSALWSHEQLKHNQPELERMIGAVKPFLFN